MILPPQSPVAGIQIFVAPQSDGVGKAGLADLTVAPALFRNGIEAALLVQSQVFCFYQIRQTLGKIEVVNGIVAEGQIQQRVEGHRFNDPGGQI